MAVTATNLESIVFDSLRTTLSAIQATVQFSDGGTEVDAIVASAASTEQAKLQGIDPGFDRVVYVKASDWPDAGLAVNNIIWVDSTQYRVLTFTVKANAVYALQIADKLGNG